MRPRPVVFALVSLLVAVAAFGGDEEAILALDRENSVATWTADGRWFERNLADDFMLITVAGVIQTKEDVVAALALPDFSMEPYEPTDVQVRVYGDTAIVTGRVLQRFTRGGKRFEIDARYSDVYARRRGRWVLVTAHASPVMKHRVRQER